MRQCARAMLRVFLILSLSLTLNAVLLLFCYTQHQKNVMCSLFFNFILKSCGIHVENRMAHYFDTLKTPSLIVSNHVSYLDILIISSIYPSVFLAKSEVSGWPVFGWVARSLGCIFVKRDSLMGRANALRKCIKKMKTSSLTIFPEGTTTSLANPEFQKWTAGHGWIARTLGLRQVICVKLSFENQAERAWTDDISLLPHLFNTLKQKRVNVTLSGGAAAIAANTHFRHVRHETWLSVVGENKYAGT